MSYMQFLGACVFGIVWAFLGWPHPGTVTLGFMAGAVLYNLINWREF